MMDSRFFPEVLQVVPGDNYTVYAYFNDGTVRCYDASALVMGPGVFARLRDRQTFVNTMTIMNGSVAWDLEGNRDAAKCIDIDPFVLYEAPVVKDPLEESEQQKAS